MIGAFQEFFSSIFNIVMVLVFVLVGMLIGIILIRYGLRPKNQILYCRERDGRGMELNVQEEDAISLETSSSPIMRFFKFGRAYEFIRRGRAFTRFFGKEGTAYTWRLQGFSKKPTKFEAVPREIPVLDKEGNAVTNKKGFPIFKTIEEKVPVEWKDEEVQLEFKTLEDALVFRWGKEAYESVPDKMKDMLRDDKVFLTVNLEPGIVPVGYEPITESVIKKKANEDMAEVMAKSLKEAVKSSVIDKIPWLLAGAGILAVASKLLGWW